MADLDPGTPPTDPTPAEPEPEQSLAEHEAEFGSAERPADPEPEPDEDSRRPPRERDDQGKFTKPPRHRAKSQAAGAADVPRIAELTKRLRDTEAERDALKAAPRPAPVAEPPARPAVPAVTAQAKPKIESFQEYGDYVEALADWKIAEARRADAETRTKETESARVAESWRTKVDAAKERYADFESVALKAPTQIPQGSLIDAWILEHRSGADVLYSLQKDPAELQRILGLSLFDQVEALTLLGQRGQPSREPAAKTGAAAATPRPPAPRPPTPVRTSAVTTADEPPGDDASLAEHERYYYRDRR